VCGLLQGDDGITLESLDQKTRDFLEQIELPPRFLAHAHHVFAEMTKRTRIDFLYDFDR
jgi:hypothetical protein